MFLRASVLVACFAVLVAPRAHAQGNEALFSDTIDVEVANVEVVVLDEGAVAEVGSHEELLRKGGLYAKTHRQQQLEAEIESEDVA